MKGVFQYLQKYTSVDANTWATIFITLIVFGLGLFFNWLAKKITKNSEKKITGVV